MELIREEYKLTEKSHEPVGAVDKGGIITANVIVRAMDREERIILPNIAIKVSSFVEEIFSKFCNNNRMENIILERKVIHIKIEIILVDPIL